jgi:hypothetical protein
MPDGVHGTGEREGEWRDWFWLRWGKRSGLAFAPLEHSVGRSRTKEGFLSMAVGMGWGCHLESFGHSMDEWMDGETISPGCTG